ncbi:MAG: cholesterol transport system auxiliary component [Aliidongia sp.]|jgi:cholesterol transport system auxiliary component|nr:cholesterol transport system auxiliary component [Aliidongia sp.]
MTLPDLASRRRFLSLSGASLLLAGCSGLIEPRPPQLYMLPLKPGDAADLPLVSWQLIVAEPVAPESLDTARIALSRSPTKLDYFAQSAWSDRAPAMIQGLIIESFENSGKIVAVGRFASDLRTDYVLQTELRDFEARYDGPSAPLPKVYVRVEAKLVKMPERDIIGNMVFTQEVTPARNDIDSIVAGFDEALGNVLGGLVAWTLRLPR